MAWIKEIDRSKFPRDAWVMCSWNKQARKWFCALFPNAESADDDPIAAGEGNDPLEAMLALSVALGALSDTGEWRTS